VRGRTVALVLDGRQIELTNQEATVLVGYLWRSTRRGAAIAAAKLTEGLLSMSSTLRPISFGNHESGVVSDGLRAAR
jgi:hypothetical protein